MPVRRSISFKKLMRRKSKSTDDLCGKYRSMEDLTVLQENLSDDEDNTEKAVKKKHSRTENKNEKKYLSLPRLPPSTQKYARCSFVESPVIGFPEGTPFENEQAKIFLEKIVDAGIEMFLEAFGLYIGFLQNAKLIIKYLKYTYSVTYRIRNEKRKRCGHAPVIKDNQISFPFGGSHFGKGLSSHE